MMALLPAGSLLLASAVSLSAPARVPAVPADQVTIETADGVTVYADVYGKRARPGATVLVFFHDALGSRGEVRPVLGPLREAGYACVAVDLRVGNKVGKVPNRTMDGFPPGGPVRDIAAAEHDVIAALRYAKGEFAGAPVVAVGCSYSAALALRVAGTRPELLDGVIAFSPAELFASVGKPATWVRDAMAGARCPLLILSARAEERDWRPLLDAASSEHKLGFFPAGHGRHGLRALYEKTAEGEAYWGAVWSFLRQHFPVEPKEPEAGADEEDAESSDEG